MTPSTQPQTLTIEEAAKVLRIGRTTAYALAREWRTTGGRSGLPVLALGRTLRVPRAALDRLLDPSSSADESTATGEEQRSSGASPGTMCEPKAQGPRK
jgi:excisionase family DNA binding protein